MLNAVGYVTMQIDWCYKDHLRTFSIKIDNDNLPNMRKAADIQSDFRMMIEADAIGAGWTRNG